MKKDRLFAKKSKIEKFSFNDEVTRVFDEMLLRSVPFYDEIQRMVVELARQFAKSKTRVYDLGCSTGTTAINLARGLQDRDVTIIAVDNSEPMLKEAELRVKKYHLGNRVRFVRADLTHPADISGASVVLLVLTLQFIRPLEREQLIKNIFTGLRKGGAVIVVEKILGHDSLTHRLFVDLYHDYKRRNGYSKLEIAKKREALENVLIPYTAQENLLLLRRNGFKVVDQFFNWYNFAGFLGVK